jgi:hypothetical protein
VRYECSNVQVSLQDDGQTIKVFLFSTYDWALLIIFTNIPDR